MISSTLIFKLISPLSIAIVFPLVFPLQVRIKRQDAIGEFNSFRNKMIELTNLSAQLMEQEKRI